MVLLCKTHKLKESGTKEKCEWNRGEATDKGRVLTHTNLYTGIEKKHIVNTLTPFHAKTQSNFLSSFLVSIKSEKNKKYSKMQFHFIFIIM